MTVDTLKAIVATVFVLLIQALILNRIHLFGYGTPLLYIYTVLLFPRRQMRWVSLIWAFLTGLCADSISNTPGVAAAAMTLTALLQPYLLESMIQKDNTEDVVPTMNELGWDKYAMYAIILIVIYCLLFFSLETFNFFNWQQWLLSVGTSAALTFLLVFVIENIRKN